MEYYSLIIVFTVLFHFSSCACGARHFGANVALGNQGGSEKFEEKPSALRNLDFSNHHRSSTDPLSRSQKETNYLKPMPILEDDKQSIMIEVQTYDHVVQTEENTKPKEIGSIRGGGVVHTEENNEPKEAGSIRSGGVVQTEENTEPKEAGSIRGGGDIEVTDYAPPHGKPPIHNQEP